MGVWLEAYGLLFHQYCIVAKREMHTRIQFSNITFVDIKHRDFAVANDYELFHCRPLLPATPAQKSRRFLAVLWYNTFHAVVGGFIGQRSTCEHLNKTFIRNVCLTYMLWHVYICLLVKDWKTAIYPDFDGSLFSDGWTPTGSKLYRCYSNHVLWKEAVTVFHIMLQIIAPYSTNLMINVVPNGYTLYCTVLLS